ncbi:uncharacterized protein LOC129738741 [Uranotaenia lowii]|uniref:uncharacterized protein LOC129738741 n=1 Tax=Uranotaenia lowii TaxID=190385 RepID=UPI00247B1FA4|nr:uncharacterized protein LOC129738741 [Uranotaenia lowii]
MEKYAVPNKLPSEEISIMAQRKARIKRDSNKIVRKPLPENRKTKFCKPEFFIADYRKAERDQMRIKRNFMKTGVSLKDKKVEHGRLILVFRHRGKYIANKEVMHMLAKLGLPYKRRAVLLELTEGVDAMLKMVEPWIIWGYPNIATVRELIYKYGLFKSEDGAKGPKKIPITSNKQVEDKFGHLGIICVEDLLHELLTVGPNFKKVTAILHTFELRSPADGWKTARKGKLRSLGGEAGFRGEEINEFFRRLM